VFLPNFLNETTVVDGVTVKWERASHAALQAWVEFDVPEGVQHENGVEYEYQMWVRGA
jgi:dihydrofolate reductase